jgi:hypothetical protein
MCAKVRRPSESEITTETWSLPVSDPVGLSARASLLFAEAAPYYGEKETRKIIQRAMSAAARQVAKNEMILSRLDAMKKPSSPLKLARVLAEENGSLAESERWGPRGSTNPRSIERHIHHLVKKRMQGIKAGTWRGPGGPVKPIAKVAIRVSTRG